MKDITVVIPTKNEEDSLGILLKEIKGKKNFKFIKEVVVVDGKSTDKTTKIAKNFKCRVIKQKNSLGYGDAIIRGIKSSKSEFSIVLDGDGSKNPIYISKFYKIIKKKNYDFVFGTRYGKMAGSKDDTILTFLGNRLFTNLGKIFFNIEINDILHTFFICRSKKFNKIKFKHMNFGFCAELPIIVKKLNIKHIECDTVERKRIAGKIKVRSFVDGYKILFSMVKIFLR